MYSSRKACGRVGRSLGEFSADENFLLSHISRKLSHQLKVRTGSRCRQGKERGPGVMELSWREVEKGSRMAQQCLGCQSV